MNKNQYNNKFCASKDPKVLQELFGFRYALGKLISKKSGTEVYESKGIDKHGNPIDLICKVLDRSAMSRCARRHVEDEVKIMIGTDHPHIVQVFSVLEIGQRIFIFMEFGKKGDLFEYTNKHGAVLEPLAKAWFSQIVSAVGYLHGKGIAHRDLKLENIFLSSNLNTKVGDFGAACVAVTKSGVRLPSTEYCGTFDYCAPEVVIGRTYDARKADTWSLGVTLYLMLYNKLPFPEYRSKFRHYDVRQRRMFKFPESPEISDAAKALITNLLQPEPRERWSIEEVKGCEWLSGEKVPV